MKKTTQLKSLALSAGAFLLAAPGALAQTAPPTPNRVPEGGSLMAVMALAIGGLFLVRRLIKK